MNGTEPSAPWSVRVPRRTPRCWGVVAALVAAVLLLTGCSDTGDSSAMRPTVTREQAIDSVKEMLREAIAQLPATTKPELEYTQDNSPCDDPTDGGPAGRIFIEYHYWLHNLNQRDYPQHFATLRRFWEDRGYRKYRDDPGRLGRLVYEDADGFRVSVLLTGDGEIPVLIASSPCVWPKGTPEPEPD